MQITYAPLRTLRDIEELERVPLDERVFSWNLNDWLTRGCALDPAKIAIRYIADADPASEPLSISYAELQARSNQAANLFHSLGVSSNDVVLYVLPTLPQLYVTMLGALACGIACGVNWMLKPEQLAELVRSTKAKVVVTLGPTQGYEVWENVQAIRACQAPAARSCRRRIWTRSRRVSRPTGCCSSARSRPTTLRPTSIPGARPDRLSWCSSRIAALRTSAGPTPSSWRTRPMT
jgi:acyl-CoA synthetase (AMP-forming)/AMP-acid ligase II